MSLVCLLFFVSGRAHYVRVIALFLHSLRSKGLHAKLDFDSGCNLLPYHASKSPNKAVNIMLFNSVLH